MIFETHAHYDDERFEEDRDALITSMPGRGVGTIINVGASIESTKTTLALSEKYPFVYAAVGVHPSDISGLNEETFAWLKEQTKKEKVAAVGEIGLDYYWDKEPEVQKQQRYWFAEQMKNGKRSVTSCHHPFQRCGSGYYGSDEISTCGGDTGSDPLLFLFERDGTGIYKNGILYRCRRCCDF